MARFRGWHPEDIKAAIRKRGVSLTALAVSHGLRPSACRESLIYPVPERTWWFLSSSASLSVSCGLTVMTKPAISVQRLLGSAPASEQE